MDYPVLLAICFGINGILAVGNVSCWYIVFRSKLFFKTDTHEVRIGGDETKKIIEEFKKEKEEFKRENEELKKENKEFKIELSELKDCIKEINEKAIVLSKKKKTK